MRHLGTRIGYAAAAALIAIVPSLVATRTAHATDPAIYFVSATAGNDGNSGTSPAQAWRTLDRVNQVTLHPGDRVLLRSGDTWRGQELDPKGSGTSDSPIVISSYGPGPRPHIAPGIGVKTYAIRLVDNGGYDISNLEISDTYGGVVAYDNKTYGHRYLHITNSVFHDITGKDTGFVTQPPGAPSDSPTPDLYFGTAVAVSGYTDGPTLFSDIHLDHDTFYRDDAAFDQVERGPAYNRAVWRDISITDSRIYDMYRTGGIVIYCTTGIDIDHVRLVQAGGYDGVGMFWGDAAIQIVESENITTQNSEILDTRRTGALQDVAGFDFEGMNINAKLLNSYVAGNEGEAFEIYVGWGGPSTGTVVDGDRLDNNHGCCGSAATPDQADVFLVYSGNDGQISNTTVRLLEPDQNYDTQRWEPNDVVLEPSSTVYAPNDTQVFGAAHPAADLSTKVVQTGSTDVVQVHNNGPDPAPDTTLAVTPSNSAGAASVVHTTAGHCWLPLLEDNSATHCLLGTLQPGQTAVVVASAQPGLSSYPAATATASSGITDPQPGNN